MTWLYISLGVIGYLAVAAGVAYYEGRRLSRSPYALAHFEIRAAVFKAIFWGPRLYALPVYLLANGMTWLILDMPKLAFGRLVKRGFHNGRKLR